MKIEVKNPSVLISPTGFGIRNDPQGEGHYGASRGSHKHKGIDFLCCQGQDVVCPIEWGIITRKAYPYANDKKYEGLVIENDLISIKLFYCIVFKDFIGKKVQRGEHIAMAQNIANKYSPYPDGEEMKPHIHLEINKCDPDLFMDHIASFNHSFVSS